MVRHHNHDIARLSGKRNAADFEGYRGMSIMILEAKSATKTEAVGLVVERPDVIRCKEAGVAKCPIQKAFFREAMRSG